MANEIQAQLSFRASKGGATVSFQDNFRQDMTQDNMVQQTQDLTTTEQLLDVGDVGSGHSQVIIKNLDATNEVYVSNVGFAGLIITIPPGKFAMFGADDTDLYVKSTPGNARILTLAV